MLAQVQNVYVWKGGYVGGPAPTFPPEKALLYAITKKRGGLRPWCASLSHPPNTSSGREIDDER